MKLVILSEVERDYYQSAEREKNVFFMEEKPMFAAELAGKVTASKPPHERMEDVLTSNVFSSFRYLNNPKILAQFLRRAIKIDRNGLEIPDIADFEIAFWPKFCFANTGYREPDVLIMVQSANRKKIAIVVEAKLDSGLSNVGYPNEEHNEENNLDGFLLGHQLADQFCGLDCGAWMSQGIANTIEEAEEKYLVFLTAHHSLPKADLREATAEVAKRQGGKTCKLDTCNVSSRLYWLNWQALYQVLEKWEVEEEKGYKYLLMDLKRSLEQKNLQPLQAWQTELAQVDNYEGGLSQQVSVIEAGWFNTENLAQVDGYSGNYQITMF